MELERVGDRTGIRGLGVWVRPPQAWRPEQGLWLCPSDRGAMEGSEQGGTRQRLLSRSGASCPLPAHCHQSPSGSTQGPWRPVHAAFWEDYFCAAVRRCPFGSSLCPGSAAHMLVTARDSRRLALRGVLWGCPRCVFWAGVLCCVSMSVTFPVPSEGVCCRNMGAHECLLLPCVFSEVMQRVGGRGASVCVLGSVWARA